MKVTPSARWFVSALLFAWMAWTSPAKAAAPSADDAAAEAARHFRRGIELFDQGAFAAAVVEFKRAHETKPHASVLYNLGQAYVALGKPVEAVEALQRYLSDPTTRLAPAKRKQIEEQLRVQRSRTGTIRIDLTPPDAVVTVDGELQGVGPLPPLRLSVGLHNVAAAKPGFEPAERSLTVIGGDELSLALTLRAQRPLPLPPASAPAAAVASPSPSPLAISPPPSVQAEVHQRQPVRVPGWAYAVGAGGMALLGTGGGLYLWNHGRFRDWQKEDQQLAEDAPSLSRADLMARLQSQNEAWRNIQRMDRISIGLAVAGVVAVTIPVFLALTR